MTETSRRAFLALAAGGTLALWGAASDALAAPKPKNPHPTPATKVTATPVATASSPPPPTATATVPVIPTATVMATSTPAPVVTATPAPRLQFGANLGTATLADFTALAGRKPSHVLYFQSDLAGSAKARDLIGAGVTPVCSWEPGAYGGLSMTDPSRSLQRIADGAHDAWLAQFCDAYKAVGGTVILRPMWEMNGSWYSWSPGTNGNTAGGYVAAWRHIVALFRGRNAGNIKFHWCPNQNLPGSGCSAFEPFFPGDDYVDYVGIDGYNFGTGADYWSPFADVNGGGLARLEALSARPLIVGETATGEWAGRPDAKAAWITDMAAYLRARPRVSAVLWFHENKERDWRIDSSSQALSAYRAVAQGG